MSTITSEIYAGTCCKPRLATMRSLDLDGVEASGGGRQPRPAHAQELAYRVQQLQRAVGHPAE